MSGTPSRHPFDRSGIAARSDFSTPEWHELFEHLEREQRRFLTHEASFRSPEYPWPRDPLHTWSRAWEYPYVFHHLRDFRARLNCVSDPVAADVGSGVTFFPFAAAVLGYDVVCTDTAAVCGPDLARAAELVSAAPGRVRFRLAEAGRLPFGDAEVDVVFCISVLEHIPDFRGAVREMARILKPGGMLLVTNDLDLRGDQQIGVEGYGQLRDELQRHFDFMHGEVTVHPANILRSIDGPYPIRAPAGLDLAAFLLREHVAKRLRGRPPRRRIEFLLAATSFALTRRR